MVSDNINRIIPFLWRHCWNLSTILLGPNPVLCPSHHCAPFSDSRTYVRIITDVQFYVFLYTDFTRSLSITTPEQTIEKAKGETAYLPCKFTLSPDDHGPLDIEWLLSPSDNQKVDQVVSLIHAYSLVDVCASVSCVHHCLSHRWGVGSWEESP